MFSQSKTPDPLSVPTHSFCLRSDGQRTDLKKKWTGDIQGDGQTEWVAFGNTRTKRTLVFIHHNDDQAVDSYWPMQGNMTVFGFGRNRLTKHLKTTPTRFTIALIETTETKAINAAVAVLCKDAEQAGLIPQAANPRTPSQ